MPLPVERRTGGPSPVTVIVLVLAVIGLVSIFGWVLSLVGWVVATAVKLAVLAAIALALLYVGKLILIGRPDR
jgi:hypothetical protein